MLEQWNVKYKTIDVTKQPEILQKYPIMSAPGIVINDKLEFTGVPSREKLKERLGIK
jgi:glutaredoxin